MSPKVFSLHWKGRLNDYVTNLAWSSNGHYLAACSASGQVVLWANGQITELMFTESEASESEASESEASIDGLGFSADGQYLAAAGQQGKVFIWALGPQNTGDMTTQWLRPAMVLPETQGWIDRLAWHPTLPWLAFGMGRCWQLWDIDQQQLITQQDFVNSSVLDIAWHPQASRLAVSGHLGVKVWESSEWDAAPALIEVPGASLAVAWSSDGDYMASGNLDHTLTVTGWETSPPWLMQGFPGKVRQVCWAPTETYATPLVAAACMEGITLWRRQGQAWKNEVLQQHRGIVSAIAFHPNQALLASVAQDGQLCLWHIPPGSRTSKQQTSSKQTSIKQPSSKQTASLQQSLKGVSKGFSDLAWHPEGRYFAAGGEQGELLIWATSNRGKGFQ